MEERNLSTLNLTNNSPESTPWEPVGVMCNISGFAVRLQENITCEQMANQTLGLFNFGRGPPLSIDEFLEKGVRSFARGNFDPTTQIILIIVFSALILFGAAGNGLVCYVVARNPHMRTPRNIFIINLAISDLTLCLFTHPFNLVKVSMPFWNLGDFSCKFVPMFAGANVFVSTISITAIALDRFQVIVYPTKDSMKKVGAAVALLSIWIISLLMASPLIIFNVTNEHKVSGKVVLAVCFENPKMHYEKGAYSIASMIFQYIVPILIVSVAHARICNKLKYRMVNQQNTTSTTSIYHKQKNAKEKKRKRKTNILLAMIGLVFAVSWLPLNVFNIIADFHPRWLGYIDRKGLIFPICHLLVLSSACTNPVLYGWLNDNFRKEFLKVLCFTCQPDVKFVCNCCAKRKPDQPNSGVSKTVMIYTKTKLAPPVSMEMERRNNLTVTQDLRSTSSF